MTDHETVEVFGKPVSLGRVLHVLEGFTLNRSRAAEVRMALGAAGGGESVDVDLDADPAGTVRTYYLDWLTEEQRKQIPARFLEEPNH
jgi:hypothetical protein